MNILFYLLKEEQAWKMLLSNPRLLGYSVSQHLPLSIVFTSTGWNEGGCSTVAHPGAKLKHMCICICIHMYIHTHFISNLSTNVIQNIHLERLERITFCWILTCWWRPLLADFECKWEILHVLRILLLEGCKVFLSEMWTIILLKLSLFLFLKLKIRECHIERY